MAKVYRGVDPKVVELTIDWLLDQRDAEGGFHTGRTHHSYAHSPFDVANAYIVYALSEAQVDKDYSREYNKAVQNAISSKDPYKVALMALASHNLKDLDNYDLLTRILVNEIKKKWIYKLQS